MARIDTLGNFLTDVASAIKEKKGDSTNIAAEDFDTEIENLPSGGGGTDWSAIGYDNAPYYMNNGYNYAKDIYDNWDNTITSLPQSYRTDKNLLFFPGVDLSNITSLSSAFAGNSNINVMYIVNANTNNINNTFYGCSGIKEIYFKNCNFSQAQNWGSTFSGCGNLTKINLEDIGTEKFNVPESMFQNCSKIEEIDLRNFKFPSNWSLQNTNYMFANCYALKTIKFDESFKFGTNTYTNSMFQNCSSLTDETLNSILHVCAISEKKSTLKALSLSSAQASRCQNLSNYQEFIDAGWTTGY